MDINFTFTPEFIPFEGVGNLLFSFLETDIIEALGQPDEIRKDIDDEDYPQDYSIYLYYEKWDLNVFVDYEDGLFDQTNFHTADLILDGVKFSELPREEVLAFIESYHSKNEIPYLCEQDYDDENEEDEFYFKNLGLTVWFDKNNLSDVCVAPVIKE